jgi:hypothetical protein
MKTRILQAKGMLLIAFAIWGAVLLVACTTMNKTEQVSQHGVMAGVYTTKPVKVDGNLDDEVWSIASVYRLSLSRDLIEQQENLEEPGEVQIAWDDKHFYVAIKFYDSDIVAEGEEDQLHHYKMGDVAELFLKPEGYTWYWELYVTPGGKKTIFWFPGRGRFGLKSSFQYQCGLQVAAQNKGTLNNWKDKDSYWTAEMAIPIRDLTSRGETFRPGSNWRILIGRYNYSRYLVWKELSMFPPLSRTNYHLYEEYGILELIK